LKVKFMINPEARRIIALGIYYMKKCINLH